MFSSSNSVFKNIWLEVFPSSNFYFKKAIESDNFEQALIFLDKSLRIDPTNINSLILRVNIRLNSNDEINNIVFSEILVDLYKIEKLNRKEPELLKLFATAYYEYFIYQEKLNLYVNYERFFLLEKAKFYYFKYYDLINAQKIVPKPTRLRLEISEIFLQISKIDVDLLDLEEAFGTCTLALSYSTESYRIENEIYFYRASIASKQEKYEVAINDMTYAIKDKLSCINNELVKGGYSKIEIDNYLNISNNEWFLNAYFNEFVLTGFSDYYLLRAEYHFKSGMEKNAISDLISYIQLSDKLFNKISRINSEWNYKELLNWITFQIK